MISQRFSSSGPFHTSCLSILWACKSALEIRSTCDRLFNKKNEARLQFLKNEFSYTKRSDLSISQYFLMIKSLCSEIFMLDAEELILASHMRRLIICGLDKNYISFVTSNQRWDM